jgi:hypothetical protein
MWARSSEPRAAGGRSGAPREVGRWAAAGALAAALALGLLAGCPRDPQSPSGGGDLVSLREPDSVLFQIQVGVANGVITQYMNAFRQDFVFNPDPVDSITLTSQNPGVFDDWFYSVEQQVMTQVLSRYSIRSVTFATVESTVVSDVEVVLREDYTLFMDDERYQGQAEFFMLREDADWRIFRWRDRQGGSDPDTTWGILKGLNR